MHVFARRQVTVHFLPSGRLLWGEKRYTELPAQAVAQRRLARILSFIPQSNSLDELADRRGELQGQDLGN